MLESARKADFHIASLARLCQAVSPGVSPRRRLANGLGGIAHDTTRISKSHAELFKTDLVPFKRLVSEGVASVMVGHMALPLLMGDDTPASLAPAVTQGLLRGEMGYEGVVVTDCLEMDAIAEPLQGGCGVEEGAVRALAAGVDVVMVCHTFKRHVGSMKSVHAAVEGGRLDLHLLEASGRRIRKMKDQYSGGWDDILEDDDVSFAGEWEKLKKANLELSAEAYRKSCTVVWGATHLPFKISEGKEVLLFTPEMESLNAAVDDAEGVIRDRAGRLRNTAGAAYVSLARAVEARAKTRHVVYTARDEDSEKIRDSVGAVVFVLRNADRSVWQRAYLKKVLGASRGLPVVLLSSCGPYDLVGEEYARAATAYILSFEFTREAFEVFVGTILSDKHVL